MLHSSSIQDLLLSTWIIEDLRKLKKEWDNKKWEKKQEINAILYKTNQNNTQRPKQNHKAQFFSFYLLYRIFFSFFFPSSCHLSDRKEYWKSKFVFSALLPTSTLYILFPHHPLKAFQLPCQVPPPIKKIELIKKERTLFFLFCLFLLSAFCFLLFAFTYSIIQLFIN